MPTLDEINERERRDRELLRKLRQSPWLACLVEDVEASRDVDAECEYYPDKRAVYTALIALLSPSDEVGGDNG